jgi:hypothetical protein
MFNTISQHRILFWLLLAMASTTFLWVVASSSDLRPSGDDYCFAHLVAKSGIFGGVIEWWKTWTGFASAMLLGNILVGFPLAYCSFSVASSIPFGIAALTVALSCLFILGRRHYDGIGAILFVIVVICAWWGYLWLPYRLHTANDNMGMMAIGLTHWQTINGTYVVQTSLLVMLSAAFARVLSTCPRWALILSVVMGLEAGFGGPALALSAMITVGLIAFFHLRRKNLKTAHIISLSVFVAVCALAALTSVKLSPGSLYRSSVLSSMASPSSGSVWEIVRFTVIVPLKIWFLTFVNIGAVSSSLIVLTTSMLISKRREGVRRDTACLIASAYLCVFSLIQCLVNRLSEYFTYSGYWHYASAQLCSFLSIILFSVWLAESIPPLLVRRPVSLLFAFLIIGAFAGNFLALREMVESMSDRRKAWHVGPSSLPGLSDIEDGAGWQMGCWKALETYRQKMDPAGFRLPADK